MSNRKMNTWEMATLSHDLNEIANNLKCLAALFNRGVMDEELAQNTLSQVGKCHTRLKLILGRA